MKLYVESKKGIEEKEIDLQALIVVGFAGKNVEKTMEHIRELEAEGIKCPKKVPVVYQCAKNILTADKKIEVISEDTSGEVEYLVLVHEGKYYIGLGSDHTDRALEAVSIHKSKQVCLKPFSTTFWPYEEIKEHFNDIELYSEQIVDGQKLVYQEGVTADLLPLETILAEVRTENQDDNILIYTGTVPLKEGFKFGEHFACKLIDKKMQREISLSYDVNVIQEH